MSSPRTTAVPQSSSQSGHITDAAWWSVVDGRLRDMAPPVATPRAVRAAAARSLDTASEHVQRGTAAAHRYVRRLVMLAEHHDDPIVREQAAEVYAREGRDVYRSACAASRELARLIAAERNPHARARALRRHATYGFRPLCDMARSRTVCTPPPVRAVTSARPRAARPRRTQTTTASTGDPDEPEPPPADTLAGVAQQFHALPEHFGDVVLDAVLSAVFDAPEGTDGDQLISTSAQLADCAPTIVRQPAGRLLGALLDQGAIEVTRGFDWATIAVAPPVAGA